MNDLDVLLKFHDFPAQHWSHLRTTNPIESTFATVRLRQRVTKGPGSRAAGGGNGVQTDRVSPRTGGRLSTPLISSPWCVLAPDSKGNSSNAPAFQDATSKPRITARVLTVASQRVACRNRNQVRW